MKKFTYTIKDAVGIHARPAGLLVKEAQKFTSEIKISNGAKTTDCKKLFGVMGLGVKCGNEITVTCEGADEAQSAEALEKFFNDNL